MAPFSEGSPGPSAGQRKGWWWYTCAGSSRGPAPSFLAPPALIPSPLSLLPFLPVVQSLETISALAANARDQLGSQESGASKGKGGFPWAQTEQRGLVGTQPLLLRVVSSHFFSLNSLLCSPVGQEGDHGWVLSLSLGLERVLGEASRPGTDSSKDSPLKIA